jgi:hypothetical protein
MRDDNEKYEFEIYHNGVIYKVPVRGKTRFLLERIFLERLMGAQDISDALSRPIPDPGRDCYALDDEEKEAYIAFRDRLDEQS